MKNKMKYFGITISFLFIFHLLYSHSSYAYTPGLPNNKFGIHFALPYLDDLPKARDLLNSSGGDWGYVTLVIQENDRDRNKWQEVFDRMRELHLIPILRLATVPQSDKWRKPDKADAEQWAEFLNSLNWVIKDRYVILFNEPNHGNEWGGVVDVNNYSETALAFAQKLKEKNPDFFIMLAGLDASAPAALPNFQDEASFLSQVINNITKEQFNNLFSGLASHSYPNPAFAGSPNDYGRGSIRTYEWELNLLNQLGIKDFPVFITETGWRRGDESKIADYFKTAFWQIWSPDSRVIAVTPFVFDYQGEPFLNFSWKKYQQDEFYPQYYAVQSLAKVRGMPEQIEKGNFDFDFPNELVKQSSYRFSVKLRNLGQPVWDKDFGYQLNISGEDGKYLEYFSSDLKRIRPQEEAEIDFFVKTSSILGKGKVRILLTKYGEPVLDGGFWQFETFPLPSLLVRTSLFPKIDSTGDDFELQIFNNKEEVVFKKKGVKIKAGEGKIDEIQNVALGRKYRLVLLKPYYLPRQGEIIFNRENNSLQFEPMIPIDFSNDGKLDIDDLFSLFGNMGMISRLLP